MEEYALTGFTPPPYRLLHDWYLACDEKGKAQDALERGVTARDPKAVKKRVEYGVFLPWSWSHTCSCFSSSLCAQTNAARR
jgi:hypothetical protein